MGDASSRRPLVWWTVVTGLVAIVLLGIAVAHAAVSAVLVDMLPSGGWTPEETTPEIDAVMATAGWSFLAFLVVVIVGVAMPLVAFLRRRSRMQQIRRGTPR